MVNGSRYYRALESVSIALALSSALTIMPDPSPSTLTVYISTSNFLQLGRSGGRPQRTVHHRRLPVNTVIHTTLVNLEPTTFRLLVRRATSSATDLKSFFAYTSKAERYFSISLGLLTNNWGLSVAESFLPEGVEVFDGSFLKSHFNL